MAELIRRLYGRKSEKRVVENAPAGDPSAPAEAADEQKDKKKEKAPGHGRAPFPPHLPREVITQDVPEADRQCSVCQKALVALPDEASERGHIEPVKIVIRRYVSKKYACPDGHQVKSAPGAPEGLVPRAKWTTETYAHIVTSKFGDHLPYERQTAMLKRQGIDLPKSTMCDMGLLVAEKLDPIAEQMRREILAESHIQADETPLKFVFEDQKREVRQGYLWGWKAKEKLVFEFDATRSGDVAKRFLGDWADTLLADGYAGYDAVVQENGITRAGCWAHGRRKFAAAADQRNADADKMVRMIARLYWIEKALRKRVAKRSLPEKEALELIRRVRDRRSRRQVEKIAAWREVIAARPTTLPKSTLGKATGYMKNQWATLLVFLDDPRVEIDNNGIERQIRPIALGKKNWLMAGSARGAKAAALLYSIINVCKAIDVDPYAYLSDVLEKVSPNAPLAELTPWAWKKAREPASTAETP